MLLLVFRWSVLGPFLWNIAFDSVLRLRAEEGCHTVCYADDTLLISTSNSLFQAIVNINIQIARFSPESEGIHKGFPQRY